MSGQRALKNQTKTSTFNQLAPWLLLATGHIILYGLLADAFPPVWIELPVLAWLCRGAMRGRQTWNLTLCFTSVCMMLLSEPATGLGPVFIWFMNIPILFVIHRTTRFLPLLGMGLWIGIMVAAGVYSWLIRAFVTFFEYSLLAAALPYLAALTFIGFPLAIFMPASKFLAMKTRLPLALIAPGMWSLLVYWWISPMQLDNELALVWQPVWLQLLPIIGPKGLVFILYVVNALFYWGFIIKPSSQRTKLIPAMSAVAIIIGLYSYGSIVIKHYESQKPIMNMNVAIIQPMSPLKIMNNDSQTQQETAQALKDLSLKSVAMNRDPGKPSLIIWPEGAGPFAARTPDFNPAYMQAIAEVQRHASIPIMIHNVEFATMAGDPQRRYYSAISIINAGGQASESYHKSILMPFSEYIPFEKNIPILRQWLPESRSILSGDNPKPIPGPEPDSINVVNGPVAPLICYEILFPDFVRRQIQQDALWIANLTNDRWYGRRQQARQHLAFAVLRAVENRRPVARATNSGISAIVQDTGQIAPDQISRTMEPAVLRGNIVTRASNLTFFTRYGDILNRWGLTILYAGLFIWSIGSDLIRKEQSQTPVTKRQNLPRH